jgi:hypothetical protein
VIPEIDSVESERAQRPVCLDAAAGFGHRVAMLGRHGARAHRIEQHADLHTRTAALRERARDLPRRLGALENVLVVGDRPLGLRMAASFAGKISSPFQEDPTAAWPQTEARSSDGTVILTYPAAWPQTEARSSDGTVILTYPRS